MNHQEVFIEKHENYPKQSYRNRCRILAANGTMSLVVPVKKPAPKTPVTEVLIDYDTNWQKLHWRSLVSAYRSAPFFEYYADDLDAFFNQKSKILFEMNTHIHQVMCTWLELPTGGFTSEYIKTTDTLCMDYREGIHPKKQRQIPDPSFTAKPYSQVFGDKFRFQPNLSILDLVFNEGPNAISYLK